MAVIGYARVSTDGQSLQSQTEALHTAGCARVYSEKQSGAYTERPQLAKAIQALQAGQAGAIDQGLAQYSGCYRQSWRNVQVAR